MDARPAPANLERLVLEAMALAASHGGNGPELADLVNRFWQMVPDADLGSRTAAAMLDAVRAHLCLAQQREQQELKVAFEQAGQHTAVLIVTDDMSFLVDSITAVIESAGLELSLFVHPQLVVRRDQAGALVAIETQIDPDDAAPEQLVEAWMRIELRPVRDEAVLTALHNDLKRVINDVRAAVEDWPRMRARALSLADELEQARLPVPDKDISDSVALLRWLVGDQGDREPTGNCGGSSWMGGGKFVFLGYGEYEVVTGAGGPALRAGPGRGLGILRGDESRPLEPVSPDAMDRIRAKRLLTITKADRRSTVYRSSYMDYIGFKTFDGDGNVVGESRFLGLFTPAAYLTSVCNLPVVRRKVAEVVARSGLSLASHYGRDLMAILEEYPRDELLQIATDDLFRTAMGVLRLAGRRQTRLFARTDQYGRFVSCLVYLPRDRYTTANQLKIQAILQRELQGIGVDFAARLSESGQARLHFIVHTDPAQRPAEVDAGALSAQVAAATRRWEDEFSQVLEREVGEAQARTLADKYRDAFHEIYKDAHSAAEAVQDLAILERLHEPGQLELRLFRRPGDGAGIRLKMYRYRDAMPLSDVLPVLQSLGVRVLDERPYEVSRPDATLHIYDFGLMLPEPCLEPAELSDRIEEAFAAAWHGESEVDSLNELVLRAGLTWRQIVILRAYAKYLRQIGTLYSQEYIQSTMIAHPQLAARLVALFEARFDPQRPARPRKAPAATIAAEIKAALDAVESLDEDRILRSYLALIQATLRTSYFQREEGGGPKRYVAFKLDPAAIPDLPQPRPMFEIFVYSPEFEGVHLRFGRVARGGVRWSDRREDFRTEVLGLAKAQMVKNAVIVPAGAKGGFVLKQPPAQRDQLQAEAVARYRQFISALLDVTDNIAGGKVVPPPDVVRHDGDDPYLVVAADKGTASFSDIANEVSRRYGFWLGDAFASGGSSGYDHKEMGITARGVWESVRWHFRELGIDTQSQEFTVVGIGDMSGDVFGNGMLRSPFIRLVAAFDHRHIFVDPDPDAAAAFAERQRLFRQPRSTWADYDRSKISEGGGVWPRTAKKIPLSPQACSALGIAPTSEMAPADLIRAILTAPVDLLFNGAIGTYIKATGESQADAGDKANDGVRVNGAQVRARVVAEGGNLGATQRGRVEYARQGGPGGEAGPGRIYTDFIDNCAGVNCSDHEVNIKILLDGAVAGGVLTRAGRDELLAQMTGEVADLVLRANYEQAVALGAAQAQAAAMLPVHRRMIAELERTGAIDRSLEALPADDELEARAGTGLSTPELAVLLSYAKITASDAVLDSPLPDEDWTRQLLVEYFPTPLHAAYADRMADHRLRREIVTTMLVNETVNRGGISFIFRAMEETGAGPDDVIRAFYVVRDVFGLPQLWREIEGEQNRDAGAQITLNLRVRRLVDRAVRWLISNHRMPIDVPAEIARLGPGVAALLPNVGSLFQGRERAALEASINVLTANGVPEELAARTIRVQYGFGLLDIVETAGSTGRDLDEVAATYFLLSERLRIDELLSRISSLPRADRWQTLARTALRYDLYAALAAMTVEVLKGGAGASTAARRAAVEARVLEWEQANAAGVARVRRALADFDDSRADLAALSVLLRQIRTLVRSSAAPGGNT